MKKSLIAASAVFLTTSIAHAETNNELFFKPNVGLDYGFTKANLDSSLDSVIADTFNSIGVTAGARVHKNIGFEASYSKSAEESKTTSSTQSKTKLSSIGVDAMFYAPLNQNTEVFTTAGIAKYKFDLKGPGGSISDDDIAPRLGIGAKYSLNNKLSLQSSLRHSFINIGNDEVDGLQELKIGLRYQF
jgi:opacity protein-like surface antigen